MSAALDLARLSPGFSDPGIESQRLFRRLMEATARPGRIETAADGPAPPEGVSRAAGAVLLTLCDQETPLWLAPRLARAEAAGWLRFHCGSPVTDRAAEAAFALAGPDDLPALADFSMGDPKYPDRSTTLVLDLAGPATRSQQSFPPLFVEAIRLIVGAEEAWILADHLVGTVAGNGGKGRIDKNDLVGRVGDHRRLGGVFKHRCR